MNNTKNEQTKVGYTKHMDKLAKWSGITAVLAILFGGFGLGLIAIVLGIIELTHQPNPHDTYWAISGIVLGILGVFI